MAGAGGVVLSKSIPTDMFTSKKLAKYIAIISAINGIAPVIAPIIGGVMLQFKLCVQYIYFVDGFSGVILLYCIISIYYSRTLWLFAACL